MKEMLSRSLNEHPAWKYYISQKKVDFNADSTAK